LGEGEGTEEWRKFYTKEAYNLFVPNQEGRARHAIHTGKSAYKVLLKKCKTKRLLRRPGRKLENNINMDLTDMCTRCMSYNNGLL
jgi:hypothetical protein